MRKITFDFINPENVPEYIMKVIQDCFSKNGDGFKTKKEAIKAIQGELWKAGYYHWKYCFRVREIA